MQRRHTIPAPPNTCTRRLADLAADEHVIFYVWMAAYDEETSFQCTLSGGPPVSLEASGDSVPPQAGDAVAPSRSLTLSTDDVRRLDGVVGLYRGKPVITGRTVGFVTIVWYRGETLLDKEQHLHGPDAIYDSDDVLTLPTLLARVAPGWDGVERWETATERTMRLDRMQGARQRTRRREEIADEKRRMAEREDRTPRMLALVDEMGPVRTALQAVTQQAIEEARGDAAIASGLLEPDDGEVFHLSDAIWRWAMREATNSRYPPAPGTAADALWTHVIGRVDLAYDLLRVVGVEQFVEYVLKMVDWDTVARACRDRFVSS